eukprot:COSAG01_NODE_25494_length_743_cov_1.023292_1_plen_145_part_01
MVMSGGGAAHDDLTTPAVTTTSWQEELGALKPRALKQRALELGVDPERLDEADDADDVKAAVIALIMEALPQPSSSPPMVSAAEEARLAGLRDELGSMKPRALKKRALQAGVDPAKLDEADDADDVKAVVIELIMEKEQQKQAEL